MQLEIHPEAKTNFDKRSEHLVTLVELLPEDLGRQRGAQPDFYSQQTITQDQIIGDIEIGLENALGHDLGKGFFYKGKLHGLSEASYVEFIKLAENIQRAADLSEYLSVQFIKDKLFAWIKRRYLEDTLPSFSDYLLEQAQEAVKDYEVWVPIPFTATKQEFSLGHIRFQIISSKKIEEWFGYIDRSNLSQEELQRIEEYKRKIRSQYQGHAAGTFKCEAESTRAQEITYNHLSNSLSILRLFSPANHFPEFVSGAYEYGKNMVRTKSCFLVNKNLGLFKESSAILDRSLRWNIGDFEINMIKSDGLQNYDRLLTIQNPNDYQKKLLESLIIYSRNTLRRDLFDKLLYILVALETMLLRNENEPIQQNIADRIAFAIGKTVEERKNIVQTVKRTYSVRSKFVHHGYEDYESKELIRRFMYIAWMTFTSLVQNCFNFKTKDDCLNALDTIKYS